jgi:hypothetical protein
MSYEILGKSGKYWTCHQTSWQNYLTIAIAFGWVPEGAFFKNDEGGFGPHPSGSYLGNDWQLVTDEDARAFAAALNLAIDTVNAGSPLTADQAAALKEFEIINNDRYAAFNPEERSYIALLTEQYHAEHPNAIRRVKTGLGSFDVDIGKMADLAEVAALGGFTIA